MNNDIFQQFCVRPNARRQAPAQQSLPVPRYCLQEPWHQQPATSMSQSRDHNNLANSRSYIDGFMLAATANVFQQKGSSVTNRTVQRGQCTACANKMTVCQCQTVTGNLQTCQTVHLNCDVGLPSHVTPFPPSADRQSFSVMTSSSIMPDSASQFNINQCSRLPFNQSTVVELSSGASSAVPRGQVINQGQTLTDSAHHVMLQNLSPLSTESIRSRLAPIGQDFKVLTPPAAPYGTLLLGPEMTSHKVQGDRNFCFNLLSESAVPFAEPNGGCEMVTIPPMACRYYGNVSDNTNRAYSMEMSATNSAGQGIRVVKVEPVSDDFFEVSQGTTMVLPVQPGDIEANLDYSSDGMATLRSSEPPLPVPVVYVDRAIDESRANVNPCIDVNNFVEGSPQLSNILQTGQIPETALPTSNQKPDLRESEVNRQQRKRKSSSLSDNNDVTNKSHDSSYDGSSSVDVISPSAQSGNYSLRSRSKSTSVNKSSLTLAGELNDERTQYSVDDENATDDNSDNSDTDPTWIADQSDVSNDDSSNQMDVQKNLDVSNARVSTDKHETDLEPYYAEESSLQDAVEDSDNDQPVSQTSICATLCEKVTSYEEMTETCDTPAFVMECYDDDEQSSSNAIRVLRPSAAVVKSTMKADRTPTELRRSTTIQRINRADEVQKQFHLKKANKIIVIEYTRNSGPEGSDKLVEALDSNEVSEISRPLSEPETDDVIILSDNRTSEPVIQKSVQLAQVLSKGLDAGLGKVSSDVFRAKRVPNNLALSRTSLRDCGNTKTGLNLQILLFRLDENSTTLHRLIGWQKTPNLYNSTVGQQSCPVADDRSLNGNRSDVGAWRNRLCFQCIFCPYVDSSVRKLAAHIKLRHADLTFIMNKTIPFPSGSIPYLFCRHCDFISYDKLVMLLHFCVFHSLSHVISDDSFRPSSLGAQTDSLSPTDVASVFPFYCCTGCTYMSASRSRAVDHVCVKHASKFTSCFVPLVMVGRSKSASHDNYAEHANGAQYIMSRKLIFACVRCSFYSFYSFYTVAHNLHWHRTVCLVFVCDIVDPRCNMRFSALDDIVRHLHVAHRKQNNTSNCFQLKTSVTLVDVQDALPVECDFACGRITDADVPKDVFVSRLSSADQLPSTVIEIDDDNDPDVLIVDSAPGCSLDSCKSAAQAKEVRCKQISSSASSSDICSVTDLDLGNEPSRSVQSVLTDMNVSVHNDRVQGNANHTRCDKTHSTVDHSHSWELTVTSTNECVAEKSDTGGAERVQPCAETVVNSAASANCENNEEPLSNENVSTAEQRRTADDPEQSDDRLARDRVNDSVTDTCHLTCSEDVRASTEPFSDGVTDPGYPTCSGDVLGPTIPAACGVDESNLPIKLNSSVHDTHSFKSTTAAEDNVTTKPSRSRFRLLASYRFVKPSETVPVIDLEEDADVPVSASIISAEELSLLNDLP